jgi:N-acetyl-alpha-D-glucosaminyl L-malate synthase BshA
MGATAEQHAPVLAMSDNPRPLKIGIVCYPLIGGSGILATELGHELSERGHEVHFISYAQPVRLHVEKPGIHFHPVQVSEYSLFKYPDYTLPLAVKMAEVAKAHDLDLWHVHYAVPHATAAFLARQIIGADRPRILTTLHGTDTTLMGKDPNYQAAIEHALAQSDKLTTVSHSLRKETEKTFRIERPLEVIHNFFSPEKPTRSATEVRNEIGLNDDTRMVLHMSNLRPVKRTDLLLRSFAATKKREEMHLVILAGGDIEPHQKLVDELGLESSVTFRKNVGNVEDYLQAADIGFYTSEAEAFGLSILETLFFGVPVVAFDIGGIHEVLDDGASGYLPAFSDIKAAAACLDRLCSDDSLRMQMGAHAKERVQAKFSAEAIVPQYEAVYRSLVNGA